MIGAGNMAKNIHITRRIRNNRLTNIALILVTLFAILPIATTILISFKEQADITRKPPIIFPCDTPTKAFDLSACRWAVEGYQRVFAPKPSENALLGFELTGNLIKTYIPNTTLYAFSTAFFVMLLASLSGFAFSRYHFKGHNALMTGIFAVTGVPLLTNLLALYQMAITMRKSVPFFDDRLFLIFVYVGFFLPISVWITKGFFDAIPRELEESALIEGCTPLGALFRITMPLAMPGLISVFLLTFVSVWNEFIVAYLLVSKNEYKPAMFGLYDFLSQNIVNLQVLAAACIIIASPIVILFLFTRRTFFKAMVEGAVKG
ncbi:MAG: carbohydrate ABC transporter permease [Chloroflexi bacterium HGW-Chloroflexi-10]|nr:MAG: carbohydrate ABC transporter permease [Chloroflexi bacterium HGW-Chloroflexi-10]